MQIKIWHNSTVNEFLLMTSHEKLEGRRALDNHYPLILISKEQQNFNCNYLTALKYLVLILANIQLFYLLQRQPGLQRKFWDGGTLTPVSKEIRYFGNPNFKKAVKRG